MLRDAIVQLINEAVDDGSRAGINLFMENLEVTENKAAVLESTSVENVLKHMFDSAGIDLSDSELDQTDVALENISEDELDRILASIEND